ncbi:MAG: beta-ketoacyl-ACP synthase II [Victivallaceae bacterium]|nr:beta-ketoacyl-ACP synthase II [Victivallaceae bacterium]
MQKRRVVVTGAGVISCVGNTVKDFWDSLVNGRCGIGKITRFDASGFKTAIAGEVKNFDPDAHFPVKEARRLDLFCQYAAAAADDALENAGFPRDLRQAENLDLTRVGVLVSSGIGGLGTLCGQYETLLEKGPDRISPLLIPMMIGNIASGNISIRTGAGGPNYGIVTACSTATHSIGEAFWCIGRGDADMMLCGGSEAAILPIGIAGFSSMHALSRRNDDPLHASRPFDRDRDGFVMSEGAGVMILEELGHAERRGAKILAEVVGFGASADAFHITSPAPDGGGAARAMRAALDCAGMRPEQVDYINAHGTSTALNDKYETLAIKSVFGAKPGCAVSSTKGTTGHALGAAGALESIACVQAIVSSTVPPTINYETPDPECDLDVTPNEARSRRIDTALNCNLGFGGQNGILIFKRFEK